MPAGKSTAAAREHLLDLLTPVVEAAGYDLEDVSVTAAGRRSLVRVSVDKDGGIDLDAVAEVSRMISEALDGNDDGFAEPYVLEVGSPGVDRPLTDPRHWRRAAGRLVTVEVAGKALTGRVLGTDDTGTTLDVSGKQERVAWTDLGTGRVQVEFNRADADTEDDE
jgi:ribosome maturation factor RimP